MMKNNFKIKVSVIFVLSIIWFSVLIFRAFQLQVFKNDNLVGKARKQIIRDSVIYPNRGNIFDRNKYPLAINETRFSLFTIPKLIKNKQLFVNNIIKIIPSINKIKLNKVLTRKKYTWIARKIKLSNEQYANLKNLKNLYINKVPKRIYPNNNFASQIIGFVGMDNKGLSGLESRLDERLHGSPKRFRYIKDAKGRLVDFSIKEKGKRGEDIYLTIDKEIQNIAEKYLKQAVVKYHAESGGIGVMDVKTGNILAMANYPSFDPNNISKTNSKFWKSSFVTNPFEPGSIFKTLTIASAIENKVVTSDTGYYCEKGKYLVGNHLITEAESDHGHGWLSVNDILAFSSNIGTTKIAFDLKWNKFTQSLKKYGVGQKTGILIPGESRGIIDFKHKTPLRLSNISFGQGVATTGIQMLSMYAAIANDGLWNNPKLILGEKSQTKQIMSKNTSKEVVEMLKSVVEKGTGKRAKIEGFDIGGKTGTAQFAENGSYNGYIASFIGFPSNIDKKFVTFVYIVKPKKTYYGNIVAAPVFRKLTEFILFKQENYGKVSKRKDKSKQKLSQLNSNKKTTYSRLSFKNRKLPSFNGLDKKTIRQFCLKYNIKYNLIGAGIAYKQSFSKGTKITKNNIVKIYFKMPSYD